MNVLFVCMGNICRSPLAAAIMGRVYRERGLSGAIGSAGTEPDHVGKAADPRSAAVASRHGLDLGAHRARQVAATDFTAYDVIYVMDRENEADLRKVAPPGFEYKIRLLRVSARDRTGDEVPDPYEGTEDGFEQVYRILERCCAEVAGEIMTGVRFEPLARDTLAGATRLAREVFPRQDFLHRADFAFRLSLMADSWLARTAFRIAGVRRPRYWVAFEKASRRVVGVTGVYETPGDEHEALWGGWTCVAKDYRGQKLGRALFLFVLCMGRRQGKKYARTYTSTDPNEARAQPLFESIGVRVVRNTRYGLSGERKLYREIHL